MFVFNAFGATQAQTTIGAPDTHEGLCWQVIMLSALERLLLFCQEVLARNIPGCTEFLRTTTEATRGVCCGNQRDLPG